MHVDRNSYYGGCEAALTLEEAEEWADLAVSEGNEHVASPFRSVKVIVGEDEKTSEKGRLGFSRAYSLALAPQIIYARSAIISALVSSRVDQQLEFLAVGSWWIYQRRGDSTSTTSEDFVRVPNGREDVFADQAIDIKSKRALMKFLRFVGDYEAQSPLWMQHKDLPFRKFMTEVFRLPLSVQDSLLGLTLSTSSEAETTVEASLERIARHLRSIGHFGPGFGAVVPKWGGLAEIAQVGCRAGAVGGGVYVLGNGVQSLAKDELQNRDDSAAESRPRSITLVNGNRITTHCLVGSMDNVPWKTKELKPRIVVSKSIIITAQDLSSFFPPEVEGAPTAAVALVVFNASVFRLDAKREVNECDVPVHVCIHNSSTGECPSGQCELNQLLPIPLAVRDELRYYLHCLHFSC